MNHTVKEQFLVSTFFTFFLIHSSQIGIGILNFQGEISKDSEQDAWLAVILAGLSIHVLIWLIYKTLDHKQSDLIAVHQFCFGKIIGNLLSIIVLLYFLLSAFTVFRTYIEVIQVWVFPSFQTWKLGLLLGLMIYYLVSGGFRLLTGFSIWGVILPFFLFLLIYFPLQYAKPIQLLPIFNHSVRELLSSTRSSTLLYLGFEWVLIYYPFIKNAYRSQKWAHYANLFTTIIYLSVTLVTFLYINQDTLQQIRWPTLAMTKTIVMPFIERFEYIFIFTWILVIIPPLCLPIWACTRILKRISLTFKPKITLVFFIIVLIIAATYIKDLEDLKALTSLISKVGFYFIYLYIPFLFLIKLVKSHMTKIAEK